MSTRTTALDGPVRPGALTALLAELARGPAGSGWELPAMPGETIGRFEIVREVGRGGFGVVYEARDGELGRSVAFKAVRATGDAAREQRALAEAEAAARLAHPNIVHLYDVGRCERGPYLILELLRGETLDERLGRGPLPAKEAVRVAVEISRGLAHAHSQGVVHRDLKPGNVFVCEDGQVKVLDFGLAHVFGKGGVSGGTPAYMAPEQAAGESGDERSDVYALGVLVHELLTGRLPFEGREAGLGEGGKVPELRGVPAALSKLVGRMLARDPGGRPASGAEVLARLLAIQKGMEPKRLLWAGISVAVAAVVGAGVFAWRWQRPLPPGPLLTVLADVDNRTGDPDLGGLSELLRIGLEQSKRLSIMGSARVRKLVPDASERLEEGIARSAAARAGADLVIVPRVRPLQDGYDVEVRAERRATGEPAFVLREAVAAKGAVADGLDRLVTRIRRELREEPGADSPPVPIEEAVSGNPEAWRHYAEGRRLEAGGQITEAVSAYQRAIAVDSGFALAHARLGWLGARAFSGTTDWEVGAHEKAVRENLHRLPLKDRLLVQASFATTRVREGLDILDRVIASWPQDPDAYYAAADKIMVWYGDVRAARPYLEKVLELASVEDDRAIDYLVLLGRLDEALERARRWTTQAPGFLSYTNLIYVRRARGEIDQALEAARELQGLGGGVGFSAVLAMVDANAIDEVDRLCAKGQVRGWSCAALRGRRREFLSAFDASRRPAPGAPPDTRAMYHAARAAVLARLYDPEPGEVWREVEAQLRDGFMGLPCMSWHLALAGDVAGAERVLTAFPEEDARAGCIRIALAIRDSKAGHAAAALRGLDGIRGWSTLITRGEILLEAGRPGEAVESLRRWRRLEPETARYPRALLLEARGLEGMGERNEALATVRRLLRLWKDADPGLRTLREARVLERRLASGGG